MAFKSAYLKDLKLVKLVKTNKLIFDTSQMNNIESVKAFLEVEHHLTKIEVEHTSLGLFVINFANRKDKGKQIFNK